MASRVRIRVPSRKVTIPLATGAVGYEGEVVAVIPGTHTCGPASAVSGEIAIGVAIEDYSQTAGATAVEVDLFDKADLEYYTNDPTSADAVVLATDFLGKAYFKSAGVVTTAANNGAGLNYAFAGTIYAVDARDGVGIKPVSTELGVLLS